MVTYSPDVICGLCAGALVVYSNEVLKRQMLPQRQGLLEMLCISDVSFHGGADAFQQVIITALRSQIHLTVFGLCIAVTLLFINDFSDAFWGRNPFLRNLSIRMLLYMLGFACLVDTQAYYY